MHFWRNFSRTLNTIVLGICAGTFAGILMIASWDTGLAILRRQDTDDGRVVLFSLFLIAFFHILAATKDTSKFITSTLEKLFKKKAFLRSVFVAGVMTLYAWIFQWV